MSNEPTSVVHEPWQVDEQLERIRPIGFFRILFGRGSLAGHYLSLRREVTARIAAINAELQEKLTRCQTLDERRQVLNQARARTQRQRDRLLGVL